MAYTTRYRCEYDNELNEHVIVLFQSKGSGYGADFGIRYVAIHTDTVFSFNAPTVISALAVGKYVNFNGTSWRVLSFVYFPLTFTYEVTVSGGLLTSAISGYFDLSITSVIPPSGIENLKANTINIQVSSDNSELLDPIYSRQLVCNINVPAGSTVDWTSFIDSTYDEWLVLATVDGKPVFHGFLVPDEGPAPFQDPPYDLTLTATDGLKLLQQVPLTKMDGTAFSGNNTLIQYIAAILSKTNLQLPIKVYANIFHNSMLNRADNIMYDMFQQVQLDYRTFMKSATEFINCYDALKSLLTDHFHICYDNGQWVVYRKAEYQYLADGNRYYTMYDYTGTATSGGIDPEDYAEVGKDKLIRAINETQIISSKFTLKSAKHSFKYDVWPEFPLNAVFERGAVAVGLGTPPTVVYNNIADWVIGKQAVTGLPALDPCTGTAHRKSTYDAFGVETIREIEITPDTSGVIPRTNFLQSTPFPVNAGDIIEINYQCKVQTGSSGLGLPTCFIIIVPDDASTNLGLDNNAGAATDNCQWLPITGPSFALSTAWTPGNGTVYQPVIAKSLPIPKAGKMYIHLQGWSNATYGNFYYTGFKFTYTPYIAGGFNPILGDYWKRTQQRIILM